MLIILHLFLYDILLIAVFLHFFFSTAQIKANTYLPPAKNTLRRLQITAGV